MHKIKTRMLYSVIGIIAFLLIFSLWGFFTAVRPPTITTNETPETYGLPYEAVSFTTEDDLALAGWFIPNEQANPRTAVIALHGYPADKGNILPVVRWMHDAHNMLLFDFRGLGESEGRYSTIGARETKDLEAAIAYLRTRGIDRVGVWGFSMGGAVALMTAPDTPEITAVVSDSSYAELSLMAPELYRIPLLRNILGTLTGIWGRIILSIDIQGVSPATDAQKITIPTLIVHSRADSTISFRHAELLEDALADNPHADTLFFDDLIHGETPFVSQTAVREFFHMHLR